MRDKPVFPSLVFRLTPLNTPPPGAGMFIKSPPLNYEHISDDLKLKAEYKLACF